MSSMLLKNLSDLQSIQDDLETLFWLVLYNSLLYHSHNLASDVAEIVQAAFDESFLVGQGQAKGCFQKHSVINGRTLGKRPRLYRQLPLDTITWKRSTQQ